MSKDMTPEQFEICKDFHLELIRPKVKQETIDDAKNYLVNIVDITEEQRKKNDFRMGVLNRLDQLIAWSKAERIGKYIDIYNTNNNRNPSDSVFCATFHVMNGRSMQQMLKQYKVNHQCVKVLIPRIERWNKYSKMLIDTL